MGTISQERIRGLTQAAFEKLLRGLDPDRSAAGDKYENLRRKLARFFAWEGCEFGEDLADEALNRLARKLDEGEQIGGMERYAFGVARLMLKENARERRRREAALLHLRSSFLTARAPQADIELRSAVLQRCLDQLPAENRELILRYYQGDKAVRIDNRKKLAGELNLPLNALRNRALRLREKLERSVASEMKTPLRPH